MKKRTIMITLVVLGLLLLVGVGFAAWVISAPEHNEELEGNVTAYGVSTDAYTIALVFNGEDEIIFGKTSATPAYSWLTAEGVENENLSVVIDVTVTLADEDATMPDNIKVAVVDNFGNCAYISGPVTQYKDGAEFVTCPATGIPAAKFAHTADSLVYTTQIKVSYAWADLASGSQNPYEYFNAYAYSDALATSAVTYLEAVETATAGKTVTITVGNAE